MAEINPLIEDDITEETLRNYVIGRDSELNQDYAERVSGVSNALGKGKKIAGYNDLRRFFEGDHWSYFKDDGTPERVYNYCRTTVLNYTSFLASEPPEDDIPPRDNTDDIEIARSEEVEKLLGAIKEDNEYPVVFAEAVQNQSLLGDCFIFGPYVEWVKVEGKKIPRIRFKNVKRVENVRPLWSDEDFTEMEGFIFHYRVSVKKAEEIYKEQMKERGIVSFVSSQPIGYKKPTGYPMCTIQIYWDSKYMLAMIDNKIVDFAKHNWDFIPGIFVKNMSHPTRPWGVSDIEDMLDPQVEYNETVCATRGKINQVAVPHIFYSGEGEPVEYHAGQAEMIKLGAEDRLWPDPMGQSTAPFDTYTASRKNDIHHLSMISEIFYGGAMTARATGRALSVLMQGVNNKVKHKQQYWRVALKKLNASILRLVEVYVPAAKFLIQGYYKTDIFFPSVLIRDVMEEINKFNMKLQSQYTTMKNLGIPSPKEEQKIMKKEWEDTSLMIEISRSPQMRMQIQQMIAQAIAGRGEEGPERGPILDEAAGGAGHEAGEELPMAAPGVPQQSPESPEGAIAQKGFRGR
ncbi:MAG: phage portal protein [Candidatus Pacebacteria bacterium]|nr:phage portal protein [Candidatus Paceibacterota bacterium]